MKIVLILSVLLVVSSCAFKPKRYSKEEYELAENIQLFKSDNVHGKRIETIERFKVVACGQGKDKRHAGDIEVGLLKLRAHAASVGADAVVGYRCWTDAVDLKNNCWASQHCEGTAVKIIGDSL
jgi:uncharacterized protein YbjQ (UPF0145 family)